MEAINVRLRVPTQATEVKIVCMGCVHHGAAGCDEELADFWYDKVLRAPHTYLILGGDLVDGITEKDPRYMQEEVAPFCFDKKWGGTVADRQYHYAKAKWAPLAAKGKILWIHAGNHEAALKRHSNRDLTLDWARELHVPYAGYSAMGNIVVEWGAPKKESDAIRSGEYKSYRISFYSTHGSGSAQTAGSVINSAKRLLDRYNVNLALMWHLHRKMHVHTTQLGPSEPRSGAAPYLVPRDRIAAVCGTFLRQHVVGVTSYGEVKGHEPAPLGPLVVHLKHEKGAGVGDGRAKEYARLWVSDAVRVEESE